MRKLNRPRMRFEIIEVPRNPRIKGWHGRHVLAQFWSDADQAALLEGLENVFGALFRYEVRNKRTRKIVPR